MSKNSKLWKTFIFILISHTQKNIHNTHNRHNTQHTQHTHHKHYFRNYPREQYAFNFQWFTESCNSPCTMLISLSCRIHRCLSQDKIMTMTMTHSISRTTKTHTNTPTHTTHPTPHTPLHPPTHFPPHSTRRSMPKEDIDKVLRSDLLPLEI